MVSFCLTDLNGFCSVCRCFILAALWLGHSSVSKGWAVSLTPGSGFNSVYNIALTIPACRGENKVSKSKGQIFTLCCYVAASVTVTSVATASYCNLFARVKLKGWIIESLVKYVLFFFYVCFRSLSSGGRKERLEERDVSFQAAWTKVGHIRLYARLHLSFSCWLDSTYDSCLSLKMQLVCIWLIVRPLRLFPLALLF